jgi:hypothetical protein
MAIEVSHDDVKDASADVLKDLKRFQGEKEEDLRRYLVSLRSSSQLLLTLTDCIRKMPSRLGEEECRVMDRGKEGD